ncbi:hypothetical protein BAE44_0013927 [Dichanthelium oligosanthes]|uniref:Uncharacterized protein n=1 Tax=Dichanthelium oligosanthes TaxID=888268 RepID=A0A1E5VIX4_9POAL|nr:hypothetical protein BAE44_0013927 [Dichanthelium oligosanthes]
MLMVENQLPLQSTGSPPSSKRTLRYAYTSHDEHSINKQVLEFLCMGDDCAAKRKNLQLPASTRRNKSFAPSSSSLRYYGGHGAGSPPPRPSAVGAASLRGGHQVQAQRDGLLDDVHFEMGTRVLNMPEVMLDDSIEYRYHNVMAFEALHGGTDNHVTAFVLFMRDMIDSAADVALLGRKWTLKHDLAGGDAAVVRLFERLARDVAKIGKSRLCGIRKEVEIYCDDNWRVFIFKSWSKLKNTYLTSPWTFIALVVSVFFLATDAIQTVYAIMSYKLDKL